MKNANEQKVMNKLTLPKTEIETISALFTSSQKNVTNIYTNCTFKEKIVLFALEAGLELNLVARPLSDDVIVYLLKKDSFTTEIYNELPSHKKTDALNYSIILSCIDDDPIYDWYKAMGNIVDAYTASAIILKINNYINMVRLIKAKNSMLTWETPRNLFIFCVCFCADWFGAHWGLEKFIRIPNLTYYQELLIMSSTQARKNNIADMVAQCANASDPFFRICLLYFYSEERQSVVVPTSWLEKMISDTYDFSQSPSSDEVAIAFFSLIDDIDDEQMTYQIFITFSQTVKESELLQIAIIFFSPPTSHLFWISHFKLLNMTEHTALFCIMHNPNVIFEIDLTDSIRTIALFFAYTLDIEQKIIILSTFPGLKCVDVMILTMTVDGPSFETCIRLCQRYILEDPQSRIYFLSHTIVRYDAVMDILSRVRPLSQDELITCAAQKKFIKNHI